VNILVIDLHISRHDDLKSLLSQQFPTAKIKIVKSLEDNGAEFGLYALILIHVGNSADYTIIYKSKPIQNIIYYSGQLEILEHDDEGIWSPYEDLSEAIKLVSFS
jgi:hypothetical protein